MSVRIVSTFADGREARHVECDVCGWTSAKLRADKYRDVIEYWAETEGCTVKHPVHDRRNAIAERQRLRSELDKLDRQREHLALKLAALQ